jgi:hypothetical protein
VEFWLLNKIIDFYNFYKRRTKRLTFSPEYDNQIHEIDGKSYSQSNPIYPVSQIGYYGTPTKNNNIANENPKKESPIFFIHIFASFRDKVRSIIKRLTTKYK